MTLQDILLAKGSSVYTVEPESTLAEAVKELVKWRIGSLAVCSQHFSTGTQLVGIITERDLLYCLAKRNCRLAEVKVADIMTREAITGAPDDPVEKAMGVMTAKRIRHLPILSGGRLVGMVSIGDLVKAQHDRLILENHFMRDYIQS